MHIIDFENIVNFSFPECSVALGSFEALHAGHIKIIEETVKCATKNENKSLITIFKSPILKSRQLVCETLEERLNILEKLGVDIVIIFEFNESFKLMEYDKFFYDYILKIFNAKYVFTGFNYRFGHEAKGNTTLLLELCKRENIILNIIPPVKTDRIISSTYIYEMITNGEVENLKEALLRPYSISGIVNSGRNIGSKLGFPTANIDFPNNKAIIKNGVYFGTIKSNFGKHYTLINVGHQPTVTFEYTPKIEAFVFDFNENLYGKLIKLEFIKHIRDIIRFSSEEELKSQLYKDKLFANNLINEYKKGL